MERIPRVESELRRAGLDLLAPFAVQDFNGTSAPEHRLETFARPRTLAFVVGNTRAFWPVFLEAFAEETRLRESPDPIDVWVETHVSSAFSALGAKYEIRWAHDRARPIPIQRAAEVAGLAALSPSRLSIHPRFGPWIGLRALVAVDAPAETEGPADWSHGKPCEGCNLACGPAFDALRARVDSRPEDWLLLREICPVGAEHRYDTLQIRYHYTKDRAAILDALARR